MNKNYRYIWLVIATLLGFFIGGKWNIPLVAWIAPIFSLRFFRESDKAGRNFLLLWLASAIPSIISWNGATFFPPATEALFFLALAPVGLIPYVFDRLYNRRFPASAWATLVFPISVTAMDYFSTNGSPFGTFGAAAYSQRDFLAAVQIASVTGLWGITFVMSWFASLACDVWESGFKFTRPSLAFAGVIALILGLGLTRTLIPASPAQTAQIAGFSLPAGGVAAVMSQLNDGDTDGFRQAVDELHQQFLSQIRTLADQGAQIVVLQEGAGIGYSTQVERLITNSAALAQEKGIYIVLPTFDLGKTPAENIVHILDPNGEIVLTHVKYGGNEFEGTLKGDGLLQTVDTPYGTLSAVICWDADFPAVMKQAGEQNVDLMFIPSNDWQEVKDIHAGMATFRAVENGMSIFRQTGQGVSLVTDAYGKVVNRVDMFKENATGFTSIQMVNTPIGSVHTLYPLLGDAAGVGMLVGLVGLFIGLWITRKKNAFLA